MPEIVLQAEKIFSIGGFNVTNSLLLSVLSLALISVFAIVFGRGFTLLPGAIQNFIEFVVESLLNLMDSILGDRKKSEKYLPLVATIFIFILVSNWLGIFPGVGSLVYREHGHAYPLLRPPAADLNFTLALGVIAVIMTNVFGILAFGFLKFSRKFFNFSNPINFFIGILELISEMAKVISFSFRLFGNVFAGEVLLTIIFFLVPYIAPLPFLFMELFVGFIQAFVFAMLTLVFLSMNVSEEHGH